MKKTTMRRVEDMVTVRKRVVRGHVKGEVVGFLYRRMVIVDKIPSSSEMEGVLVNIRLDTYDAR